MFNWCSNSLRHFEIGILWAFHKLLQSSTRSRIRCMRFWCRIKAPQNCEHTHFLDATECDPNYNETHINSNAYNVLCTHKSDARFLIFFKLQIAIGKQPVWIKFLRKCLFPKILTRKYNLHYILENTTVFSTFRVGIIYLLW